MLGCKNLASGGLEIGLPPQCRDLCQIPWGFHPYDIVKFHWQLQRQRCICVLAANRGIGRKGEKRKRMSSIWFPRPTKPILQGNQNSSYVQAHAFATITIYCWRRFGEPRTVAKSTFFSRGVEAGHASGCRVMTAMGLWRSAATAFLQSPAKDRLHCLSSLTQNLYKVQCRLFKDLANVSKQP